MTNQSNSTQDTEDVVARVAKAIERAWSRNHASIRSDPNIAWKVWTPEAEAAIEALRSDRQSLSDRIDELTQALERIADHTGRRKVPDARHVHLIDVTHCDLQAIARAALHQEGVDPTQ